METRVNKPKYAKRLTIVKEDVNRIQEPEPLVEKKIKKENLTTLQRTFIEFCKVVVNKHDTDALLDFIRFTNSALFQFIYKLHKDSNNSLWQTVEDIEFLKKRYEGIIVIREIGLLKNYINQERQKVFTATILDYWNDYKTYVKQEDSEFENLLQSYKSMDVTEFLTELCTSQDFDDDDLPF